MNSVERHRLLTSDEAHAAACAAFANHAGIQDILQRWGDALWSSLQAPCDDSPEWIERVLIGESDLHTGTPKATFVGDRSEKTFVIAACRVHPESSEAVVAVEPSPREVNC